MGMTGVWRELKNVNSYALKTTDRSSGAQKFEKLRYIFLKATPQVSYCHIAPCLGYTLKVHSER